MNEIVFQENHVVMSRGEFNRMWVQYLDPEESLDPSVKLSAYFNEHIDHVNKRIEGLPRNIIVSSLGQIL